MARALMEDKKEWRLKEVDNKKKNYGNRALLGDKRGPIFGSEKEAMFEKELNEWECMLVNYTGNAH